MNGNMKTARAVGALFLAAMVTSLVGGGLIDTVLNAPDLVTGLAEGAVRVRTGVFLEMINGIAVVGIGVMMYPLLRRHGEGMALGYVGFRVLESGFVALAAAAPLRLLAMSQLPVAGGEPGALSLLAVGELIRTERDQHVGFLIPVFFCLGAVLLYALLYRSRLLPRFIALWGFAGVALIAVVNLVEMELGVALILALPIITNEIFMGVWLMAKGFNPPRAA